MSNLRPFWERHKWLIRPAAVGMLIMSPIVFPILVIVEYWDSIRDMYRECWNVVIKGRDFR